MAGFSCLFRHDIRTERMKSSESLNRFRTKGAADKDSEIIMHSDIIKKRNSTDPALPKDSRDQSRQQDFAPTSLRNDQINSAAETIGQTKNFKNTQLWK